MTSNKKIQVAIVCAALAVSAFASYYPSGEPIEPQGHSDVSTGISLATGTASNSAEINILEARFRTWDWSIAIPVDSSPRRPLIIFIR